MLTNLRQLSPWLWIVAIIVIVVITILIIWARRRKLRFTKLEVAVGPIKADFEPEEPAVPSTDPTQSSAVNISGNWMLGNNKVDVRREGINIANNLLTGENEIKIGAKPGPKPKGKKKK